MVRLAPRAQQEIVRPRRLTGLVARPLNFTARRPMTLSPSRLLSLVVVLGAYVRGWWLPSGLWLVTLVCWPVLALIWFPEQIDDLSFGTWSKGAQIDTHTPPAAIAALGWIVLLLFTGALLFVRSSSK